MIGFVLGIILAAASLVQQPAPNPYSPVQNWAKLPASVQWGQVSGVEFDSRGNLWVIHRAEPPIMAFDASGNFLRSFGDGMFVQAHSLHFDRDGNLWATDG